jgi:hypothetical protein
MTGVQNGRTGLGGVDQGGVDQGGVDQGGVDQGGVDQGAGAPVEPRPRVATHTTEVVGTCDVALQVTSHAPAQHEIELTITPGPDQVAAWPITVWGSFALQPGTEALDGWYGDVRGARDYRTTGACTREFTCIMFDAGAVMRVRTVLSTPGLSPARASVIGAVLVNVSNEESTTAGEDPQEWHESIGDYQELHLRLPIIANAAAMHELQPRFAEFQPSAEIAAPFAGHADELWVDPVPLVRHGDAFVCVI